MRLLATITLMQMMVSAMDRYLSDKSDDELQNDEWNHLEDDAPETDHCAETPTHPTSSSNIIPPPAQK
jgi:hypothetical protein